MKLIIALLILAVSAGAVSAQSGRQTDGGTISDELKEIRGLSVEQLYTKASNYALDKFTELEQKNAPYSETVHKEILQEQKQLAAKYASSASTRQELAGRDLYFLGRLHWLATNSDDAAAAFEKFLSIDSVDLDPLKQTARSVVVVMAAGRGEFDKAEAFLAEYTASKPRRLSEEASMKKELAFSYTQNGNFRAASPHAGGAFEAATALLFEDDSRGRALSRFLDSGITSFRIEKELGRTKEADGILDKMQKYAATVRSHSIYYRAVDERIRFWIETGRKKEALEHFEYVLDNIEKEIPDSSIRSQVTEKLKNRQKHYEILGEPAPELDSISAWIPGEKLSISGQKGKVILLDFWATWCGPCFEAFPALTDWHNRLSSEGLLIYGVTRFYGQAGRKQANEEEELQYLEEFKQKEGLPYPFAVATNQTNQIQYGAWDIPTTVLIDRKGIVRYVETGTSENREREVLEMIEKLLSEEQ